MSEILKHGDLVKYYHFTGKRKKKHYMYKLIVESENGLMAVDVVDIALRGMCAHRCSVLAMKKEFIEVIAGDESND